MPTRRELVEGLFAAPLLWAACARSAPAGRSPMTNDDDGRRDFDFLFGRWKLHNSRLARRLAGSTEWQEFEATSEVWPVLGGLGNFDTFVAEPFVDGEPLYGADVKVFDPRTREWKLYWMDHRTARVQPPLVGRFSGGRVDFYGDDTFDGKPIRVRCSWFDIAPASMRWEQAFSPDGGKTWEVNWRSVITREA